MNADELKQILQVLKDFEVGAVKLEMNDLKLELAFHKSIAATQTPQKRNLNFPEAKHMNALMTPQSITPEELAILESAGLNPNSQTLTNENIAERVKHNLSKKK